MLCLSHMLTRNMSLLLHFPYFFYRQCSVDLQPINLHPDVVASFLSWCNTTPFYLQTKRGYKKQYLQYISRWSSAPLDLCQHHHTLVGQYSSLFMNSKDILYFTYSSGHANPEDSCDPAYNPGELFFEIAQRYLTLFLYMSLM